MQQSVTLVRCKIAFDTGIIKILGAKQLCTEMRKI